jgi:hypothetical protein
MKQKILLCWNYERKNWVSHFEEIFNEGEYVFLNFYSKALEKECCTREIVLYWNDFKSVDHLIDQINPATVIFMGLDSPYAFLLNHACKERGIKTCFLQHGIFHSYQAYLYEEESMRKILAVQKPANAADNILEEVKPVIARSKSFFLRSFKIQRARLYFRIIKFLFLKKALHSVQKALKAVAGEIMQPDCYIVYTKHLSKILLERDNVDEKKIIEIGNDEGNRLIKEIQNTKNYSYSQGSYYLFIDEAFSGSEEFLLPAIVSASDYNNFLLLLSDYAKLQNKRLMVKLHPFSYNVNYFVKNDNIDYVKQVDIADMISNACGVFGFSSTLLIPAIFVKRACIFKLNNFSDIHQVLAEIGYCKVLDFHALKLNDIAFNEAPSESQVKDFIKYFLFKLDLDGLLRLKTVLHSS